MAGFIGLFVLVVAILIILNGFVTVNQGTIAVLTMFGKYQRILLPGLRFKIPIVEQVYKRISIQNRSVELELGGNNRSGKCLL